MTYREIVYMVLDELKGMSDDFTFTEDHIAFLCGKYRSFLLKQRYYTDIKKAISESNYQTICLDLIEVPAISGEVCEGGSYLRSKDKIPVTLMIGNPRVYPIDYYQGEIAYISRDRMRYVGYNKWMKNIIYCSIAPDGYLYSSHGIHSSYTWRKSSSLLYLRMQMKYLDLPVIMMRVLHVTFLTGHSLLKKL